MSYYIYQTEGIILSRKDVGEADRIFSILTRDLGRIDAISQGVRYLKSKLRYNLKIFSYSRLGLVMTRDSWRIVDAEELRDWQSIRGSAEKLAIASTIAELINRMVRGQEFDSALWEEVKSAFHFLEKSENLDNGALRTFELLTTVRTLACLGYVAEPKKWLNLSLGEARNLEPLMASIIKTSLEESQL